MPRNRQNYQGTTDLYGMAGASWTRSPSGAIEQQPIERAELFEMVRGIRDIPDPWAAITAELRAQMTDEDFRRWFGPTAYASDSGDQITVWVPSESIRRHIQIHFRGMIDRALETIGRADTSVRLIVAGMDEDEAEDS